MKILTPGANRRLNELMGFLLLMAALLVALSLLSYSPLDPSLNTAGPPQSPPAHNWIGVVGAFLADALLQALGYIAFLLPLLLLIMAWQWFRSQPASAPLAKTAGTLLLLLSLTTLLGLMTGIPLVHGLMPPGGLLGVLLALGLTQAWNLPGAYIVSVTVLVVGVYLTTSFSFSSSKEWIGDRAVSGRPLAESLWTRLASLKGLRWRPWRRAAEGPQTSETTKPRIVPTRSTRLAEAVDISAPSEIGAQGPSKQKLQPQVVARVEEDDWDDQETVAAVPSGRPSPVPVARIRYRLPSAALLRTPEHVSMPRESELRERAEILRQSWTSSASVDR